MRAVSLTLRLDQLRHLGDTLVLGSQRHHCLTLFRETGSANHSLNPLSVDLRPQRSHFRR
jgi:hypothetical protein